MENNLHTIAYLNICHLMIKIRKIGDSILQIVRTILTNCTILYITLDNSQNGLNIKMTV